MENKIYNEVPNIITGKDLDYLSDMFNWNYEVLKKMAHYKKKINSYTYMDIAKFAVKIVKENPEVLNSFKNNTKEILVDEYQDTSDIQEELIQLIANNNLYLVGDVKQAIYRFRNANPLIFTEKLEQYGKGDGGVVIDLTYNFRSRNEVLENINQIFTGLMEKKFGGVDYEGNQKLSFGNVRYNSVPKPNNYQYELLTHDIKNEEIATGPLILRIQGLNFPTGVILLLSQILPIATSVKASTNRAIIITIPTTAAETPITSV